MAPRKRKPTAVKRPRARKPAASTPIEDAQVVQSDAEAGDDSSPAELDPASAEPAEEELAEVDAEVGGEPALPKTQIVPVRDRDVVRRDPLQAYMAEVGRHRLLTREEEHDLAVRYRQTGDVDAAYRLVAANLRLVVKLAHEYHRNPLSLLDLIQEGNIGLMQAVKKYDPERGVKLSTYAAWWIRAYILRYIMDNWKMVKLGTTEAQRKLFFKLRQEQDRLAKQGVDVTPKLLAERLNVTEQDIVEMDQRLGHDELSIDAPISDESGATRGDRLLPPSAAGAEESLASEQLKRLFRERVGEFARTLKDKERFIFEKRLMSDEPMTLQEIGDQYGFSRERARQIEAALIVRMREYMREHIPDFDLVAAPKD
jgi:RNA polymerase sigma-32 factor